jgi:Flp pilus assembly protein TadG
MLQRLIKPSDRRGTTVVETAIVLPVFLFFVFGLFEYAHARMVSNMLKTATRTAARYGATEGATTAEVRQRANQILASVMDPAQASILVKDASVYDSGGSKPSSNQDFVNLPNKETSTAETRDLFLVRATVDYNDIALLPMPFMDGVQLSGQAFMRHE